MKTLADPLAQYAAGHRDHRNPVTDLIGIPMIVVAVTTLTGGLVHRRLGPHGIGRAGPQGHRDRYHLRLDRRFGAAMAVAIGTAIAAGQWLAGLPMPAWLGGGLGLVVVGWGFQFVGHH